MTPKMREIGPVEAEAIARGEAPQWQAVARRMDEIESGLTRLRDGLDKMVGRSGP